LAASHHLTLVIGAGRRRSALFADFRPVTASDTNFALPPAEPLGRLLARLRTERGLPQKQVAQLAGIDGSTLSRLESDERGVSREVLDRLCAALELDRRERLDVLVAAEFITEEAARLLADDDLASLARLLTNPAVPAEELALLRQYVRLALAHVRALGYDPEHD
jgi:transcriptional regulator with XRE-family HTH domain